MPIPIPCCKLYDDQIIVGYHSITNDIEFDENSYGKSLTILQFLDMYGLFPIIMIYDRTLNNKKILSDIFKKKNCYVVSDLTNNTLAIFNKYITQGAKKVFLPYNANFAELSNSNPNLIGIYVRGVIEELDEIKKNALINYNGKYEILLSVSSLDRAPDRSLDNYTYTPNTLASDTPNTSDTPAVCTPTPNIYTPTSDTPDTPTFNTSSIRNPFINSLSRTYPTGYISYNQFIELITLFTHTPIYQISSPTNTTTSEIRPQLTTYTTKFYIDGPYWSINSLCEVVNNNDLLLYPIINQTNLPIDDIIMSTLCNNVPIISIVVDGLNNIYYTSLINHASIRCIITDKKINILNVIYTLIEIDLSYYRNVIKFIIKKPNFYRASLLDFYGSFPKTNYSLIRLMDSTPIQQSHPPKVKKLSPSGKQNLLNMGNATNNLSSLTNISPLSSLTNLTNILEHENSSKVDTLDMPTTSLPTTEPLDMPTASLPTTSLPTQLTTEPLDISLTRSKSDTDD